MARAKNRKIGFLSFFLFSLLLFPFSLGYTILDYENFDDIPIGTTGNALMAYGFLNESAGLSINLSNGAIFPESDGGSFIFCTDIPRKFTLVPESYYATGNNTLLGIPFNMSYRYRIRATPNSAPYLSNQYGQVIPRDHRGATTSATIIPSIRLYANVTGVTRVTGWQNTSKSAILNPAFPIDYGFHDIQADYWFINSPSASYKQVYNVSFTIDGIYTNSSLVDLATTGTIAQRINATLFDNVNLNYCFIVDDLIVLAYEFGESFVPVGSEITGLPASDNQMPEFNIILSDYQGFITDNVKPGVSDMFFTADDVIDAENNSVYWGIGCGDHAATIKAETYTGDPESIKAGYGITANATLAYYDSDSLGIILAQTMNDTAQSLLTYFASDLSSYTLLPDNSDHGYLIDLDFQPGTLNTTRLDIKDFNNNLVYSLCIGQDNNSGYFGVSASCAGDYSTLADFEFIRPVNIRLIINALDDSISYRLLQVSNLSEDRLYFSPKTNIAYPIPIKSLSVYGFNSLSGNIENSGELIGNFLVREFEIPALSAYPADFVKNCSSTARIGAFLATAVFTDSAHNGNWANFAEYPYSISLVPPNDDITGAFDGDALSGYFDSLFQGSDFLKYLFVIFILAIVTIGSMAAGAYAGSASMGMYAALLFDCIAVFVFAMVGFVPFYIPVIITIIAALLITFLIMRPFGDGGGGGI